jgi:hypothetical protein
MGCLIAFRIAAQRSAVFTASARPLPLPAGIRAFLLAAGLSSRPLGPDQATDPSAALMATMIAPPSLTDRRNPAGPSRGFVSIAQLPRPAPPSYAFQRGL